MNLQDKLTHKIFRAIGQTADEMQQPCYVVGGVVRDLFLARPSTDLDFVTVGSGIALAEAVAKNLGPKTPIAVYQTSEQHRSSTVNWNSNL